MNDPAERLIERLSTNMIKEIIIKSLLKEKGNREYPYNLFKWWSRRFSLLSRALLASLIVDQEELLREVINGKIPETLRKLSKNKLIYDPFMGAGTIVIEALKLGFDVYGVDINPVSERITYATLRALNRRCCRIISECLKQTLIETYELLRKLWILEHYMIIHVFLSRCPPCTAPIWISKKHIRGREKYIIIDEESGEIKELTRKEVLEKYNSIKPTSPVIDLRNYKLSLPEVLENVIAYAVEVFDLKDSTRKFISLIEKSEESADLRDFLNRSSELAKRIYLKKGIYDIPIPSFKETARLLKNNIKSISKLFTWRQLVTLLTFVDIAGDNCKLEASLIAGTVARTASLLAIYYQPYSKVNPGLVIKSYWLPINPVELNPLSFKIVDGIPRSIGRGTIATYVNRYIKGCLKNYMTINSKKILMNGNSLEITPPQNLFAIVTDPPYPGYHTYADLGLLYLYFLSFAGLVDQEFYLDSIKGEINTRDFASYVRSFKTMINNIRQIAREYYVVLLLGASSQDRISLISEIITSFVKAGFGLRKIYWLLGESPGGLGRSRSRSIFAIVLRNKTDNSKDALKPLLEIRSILKEIENITNIDPRTEFYLASSLYRELDSKIK